MADLREKVRLEVELTADQVRLIDEAVQLGEFSTRADAVLDAVEEWNFVRSIPIADPDLKRLCEEGLKSGDFLPAEEVFQRLREKYTKRTEEE